MDLRRRGLGAYAAQPYLVHLEGVGSAESRSDIMSTSDIIQDYNNTCIREFLILISGDSPEFDIQKFPVLHINPKVFNTKVIKNKKMSIFAFALNQDL